MTETKLLRRRLVIMIAAVALAVAGMALLILRFGEPEPASQTEPPTQTTAPPTPTVPPSSLTAEDFVQEDGYLSCIAAETMLGIDVSHHQQVIDWQQVKAAGIQFVMIRLGYRGIESGLLKTDDYAQQNLSGAREAGLLVGAYFYSQATSAEEAREEAAYALEVLGDFQLDLPLSFDWEIESRTESVDIRTATDCAIAFCTAVEDAGYDPMIYFNSYQATQRLDLLQLTQYPWWLAMYDTDREFPCRFDLWQYTCTGSVPGIDGNVDINLLIKE